MTRGGVRWPEVREIGEQIVVGANAVCRHLPVREDREEVVLDVVDERAAILWIRGRPRVIEGQDVREQRCGHPLRIGSGVAAGVFERVREHGDELAVVGRFGGIVGGDRLASQEGGLRRPRAAVGLLPAAVGAVQGPGPNADPPWRQGDIGNFEDDAAHVLIGEEVLVGELEAVQHAKYIEEEGVAPPAGEQAVLANLCYVRRPTQRDRRRFDKHVSRVAYPGGCRTPDAA